MQKNLNFLFQSNPGFTLLELLITTALTVILLLAITSLFMTSLLGNAKTNARKSVKEEGLQAMSQMEFLLKNAHYIDTSSTTCVSGMSSVDIVSLDGGTTTLNSKTDAADGNHLKIASTSAVPSSTIYLTSSDVTLTPIITFDCSGDAGNRQVKITFGLEKITPDGTITENFNSSVNVRN